MEISPKTTALIVRIRISSSMHPDLHTNLARLLPRQRPESLRLLATLGLAKPVPAPAVQAHLPNHSTESLPLVSKEEAYAFRARKGDSVPTALPFALEDD